MLGPAERQAAMAHAATECVQERYAVVVEIACATNSSAELVSVKQAYHVLYRRSLEEDVAARATGNLRSVRRHTCMHALHLHCSVCRLG